MIIKYGNSGGNQCQIKDSVVFDGVTRVPQQGRKRKNQIIETM